MDHQALWTSFTYVGVAAGALLLGAVAYQFFGPWGIAPAVFLGTWFACYMVMTRS